MDLSNIDMRDAFFDRVYELAQTDPNLIFLTADHGAFSLEKFKRDLPKQYINVGISEQNMVSIAAGLALSGKTVFIYSIVTFVTLRCLEQINIDLCAMKLPVHIVSVGAGFTYCSDGPTHHGTQDVAIMSALPNLTIYNSSDPVNTYYFADLAYETKGPTYIRIEKGKLPPLYPLQKEKFRNGFATLKEGKDLTIIATGVMVHEALKISNELAKQSLNVGVIDLFCLKPIDEKSLIQAISQTKCLLTLEENISTGGIGTMVSTILSDHQIQKPLKRISLGDKFFFDYGNREWMQNHYNLDTLSIISKITSFIV